MAYRIVLIENDVKLNLKLNNLVINKDGQDIWIPLNDISMIIIDNLTITLTTRLMCRLAENGIGMIICDIKHLPIGYYGSYDNQYQSSKVLGEQLKRSGNFYNLLWKTIVEHKIRNQANAYYIIKKDMEIRNNIYNISLSVTPGDKTNREALAAKVYFTALMGESFVRHCDDFLFNSGLDYGYAIIRSYIARSCVGYGLNTQLGIHHKNQFNRFNLVDDLIEPIRPFVDVVAYNLLLDANYFTPEHRRKLVNILNSKILYKGKKMYLCNMLDDYVSQYEAFLSGRTDKIIFPNIEDYLGEQENEI